MTSHFLHYKDFVGARAPKFHKATLARSERLLLGLNCLEPGQEHAAHIHHGQDKFYFVIEGEGEFEVAGEKHTAGAGEIIWAPAKVPHGVANRSTERLVLLVGMAPAPDA